VLVMRLFVFAHGITSAYTILNTLEQLCDRFKRSISDMFED
jgi:hypothetical protein